MFTGKAVSAGPTVPNGTEDVSDLVAIVSPHEAPLLDALGDPLWPATSTHHEWLEDELLPDKDAINHTTWRDPRADRQFEVDYQKQKRLRELLRDLENTVINRDRAISDLRTMKGIIPDLATNVFHTGDSGFPAGNDLDETKVNYVLRNIWKNSSGNVDLIVMSSLQKRKISHMFVPPNTTSYASDFGVCRIVTTRWMPQDAALFLDSSRIAVLPLTGRSFHYKTLASADDYELGELVGEYTLELENEAAHGLIRGLSV